MTINSKAIDFLIIFLLFAATTSYAGNLGVAKEMLEPILPQEFEYTDQPQNVWQAVFDVVDSRITLTKGRVLAKDSVSHTISWIEQLDATLGEIDNSADDHKSGKGRPLHESEVLEVGQGGIAITTVSVRERSNGSLMRIRRVYYGRLTQPRMVHSRGFFANLFQDLVNQKLGINADYKVL